MLTKNGIKLDGYKGKYYVIDQTIEKGKDYYLLESELYGDEAPCIIVDGNLNIILSGVTNGLTELEDL